MCLSISWMIVNRPSNILVIGERLVIDFIGTSDKPWIWLSVQMNCVLTYLVHFIILLLLLIGIFTLYDILRVGYHIYTYCLQHNIWRVSTILIQYMSLLGHDYWEYIILWYVCKLSWSDRWLWYIISYHLSLIL